MFTSRGAAERDSTRVGSCLTYNDYTLLKILPGANTLAYFASSSVTKKIYCDIDYW
jgi:hypothetical protein